MELLEIIMRVMDNYPIISIAFCLLIALGLIIYKVIKLLMDNPHNANGTGTGLMRYPHKLVKEQ